MGQQNTFTIPLNLMVITVIMYGRMIEIYLYTSLAPIPFATMSNREWGHVGTNYFRGLFALAFQAFLMMVCVAIYAALIGSIRVSSDIHSALFGTMAYTVILLLLAAQNGKSVQTDLRQSLNPGKSNERKRQQTTPFPGGGLAVLVIHGLCNDTKRPSKVKNKVFLNLTKRQLVCMGFAAGIGVPFYFLMRDTLGTSNAAAGMVLLMLPEFFFALYEKNGMHL